MFKKIATIIIATIVIAFCIFAVASASTTTMEDVLIDVVRKNAETPLQRNIAELQPQIEERLGCLLVHISTERVYALYEDRVMVYKFETDFNTLEGDWWPTLNWASEAFLTFDVTMDDGTVIQIDADWESVCL